MMYCAMVRAKGDIEHPVVVTWGGVPFYSENLDQLSAMVSIMQMHNPQNEYFIREELIDATQ